MARARCVPGACTVRARWARGVRCMHGGYTVRASVAVPASFATAGPSGGLRVRLRVPLAYAGKLSGVTVGGAAWSAFDAAEETVDFSAAALTADVIQDGLPRIIAAYRA